MRIEPAVITAISTSQTVLSNRVETVRRQYVDVGGRIEIRETYYYYTLYDRKGQVAESEPQGRIDLRV